MPEKVGIPPGRAVVKDKDIVRWGNDWVSLCEAYEAIELAFTQAASDQSISIYLAGIEYWLVTYMDAPKGGERWDTRGKA